MSAADGKPLLSMIVFKGQPKWRIAKMEFSTYPATTQFYRSQPNVWMDEEVTIAWVDKVLAPYIATATAPGSGARRPPPLIVLDSSYRCHMMASVVQKIQELGVEVKHIPGGCTSPCQPVGLGLN